MVLTRIAKRVLKIGNDSLCVIIDKPTRQTFNIEEGDMVVVDIVRRIKKKRENGDNK